MATTTNVPSTNFEDLQRDVQDATRFSNATGTYINRVGKSIRPIPLVSDEIESNASSVASATTTALSSISSNSASVSSAASSALSTDIPNAINSLGLQYPPITYTAGLTLDSYTKTYEQGGSIYLWGGALGTTTTGAFDEGSWQPLQGDLQLRRDIAEFNSLADLITNTYDYGEGKIAKVIGLQGGQWKSSSTTGLTPNQTPDDRLSTQLVDGTGRLWNYEGKELNMESIGAIGDGAFDNFRLFIAAKSWSNLTKGKVKLGPGTFLYSSRISTSAQFFNLEGASREETVLLLDGSVSDHAISVSEDGTLILEKLTINQNSAGNGKTAGNGIRSGGCLRLRINDVRVTNCTGYGIGIQEQTNRKVEITNFEIDGCGSDAIDIKDRNFDNECVIISDGVIKNFSTGDSDDVGIDARGEVLVNNVKITASSSCNGVRLRLGTPSAGRSGFGAISNVTFDGAGIAGTIAVHHESDSRLASYNNITVKDCIYPIITAAASKGGILNGMTATGSVVCNFGGEDFTANAFQFENISAASRMLDFGSGAKRNRLSNVNLKNNASSGELARHQSGADNNQIVGGFTNTIAVNQLGTNWVLNVTQITY